MAKFYGVNPGATKDVPLEHFVGQIGKENVKQENASRPQTTGVNVDRKNSIA